MKDILPTYRIAVKKLAIFATMFLAFAVIQSSIATAETIKHDIKGNFHEAEFFSHTLVLNSIWYKEIRYFIVREALSEVKVALDACDYCHASDRGYSHVDSLMKCNACGNGYLIRELGNQESDGCHPVKLNYYVEDGWVYIDIADLESKEKYFPIKVFSGVNENTIPDFKVSQKSNSIDLHWDTIEQRKVSLIDIRGIPVYSTEVLSNELTINIQGLYSALYFLLVEEKGKLYTKTIQIIK